MENGKSPRASLRDFLHVIFKRKIQILLFCSLTVLTVGIGSLMMDPTYESYAQILIKLGRENVYVPTLTTGGGSPVIKLNQEEQINSEIEIMISRFLAQQVVDRLGPAVIYPDLERPSQGFLSRLLPERASTQSPSETAATNLLKDLTVEAVRKSDVITVSFRHRDPKIAATVVNTLVTFYLDRHLEVHKSAQSYDFFREQSQVLKGKLKQAEEDLARFKKHHNLTAVEEQRLLLVRNEAERRAALNLTVSQEAETGERLRQLQEQLAQTPRIISLDEETGNNPYAVSSLKAKLVELELKEHELLARYNEKNHWVESVRTEIQLARKKLAEQEAARYGRIRSGVNPTYQTLHQDLLRNEAELKALRGRLETQRAQLAEYQHQLEKFNAVELEFNRLQQELEVDRQNYRLYLARFEESRISNAMDKERITNVSLIDPASAPTKPVSPKIRLMLALAVLLGGIGAIGLAMLSEYLDDRLEKAEDVENLLHVPVLASIPEQRV